MPTLARLVVSFAAALALIGHSAPRIPSGVRMIDVHSARGTTRSVRDPAKVAKIVRWFEALPVAPHRHYYCPLILYRRPTILEFRTAGGAVVVRARTPGSAACGASFDYSVRGQVQKPVLTRHFLVRLGRLLQMRLGPVPRV